MTSFEKWLKKNKFDEIDFYRDSDDGAAEVPDEANIGEDVVSVRALGEWAFEIGLALDKKYKNGESLEAFGRGMAIQEIAVACLGRAEIEKRLKEATK